jgi:hypothetical protein
LSGGAGGISLVFVGHPLDLIKVRLQTMPTPAPGEKPMYTGMGDVFKQTIAKEGVRKHLPSFSLFRPYISAVLSYSQPLLSLVCTAPLL